MAQSTMEQRIDELVGKIQDPFLKNIFTVTGKHSKYPKDCINDGALEKALGIILELEKRPPCPD